MADPFSLVASVTGLLAVGLHTSRIITQIISDTRSAPKAIRSLSLELNGLCKILGSLEALLQGGPLQSATFPAEELSELLENVMGDFIDLQAIAGAYAAGPSHGALRQRWEQFLWVFRDADLLDLKKNIEAYKASLNLTLSIAELSGVSQVVQTNEELRERMGVLTMEISEVRALCQQLKGRQSASSASPQRINSSSSTTPLSLVVTNESSASRDSVASSYRAASIIECYYSRIELIRGLPIRNQELTGPNSQNNGLSVSRAVTPNLIPIRDESIDTNLPQEPTTPDTSIPITTPTDPHHASQEPSYTSDSRAIERPVVGVTYPDRAGSFPRPITCTRTIIPTSDATDNKYVFSGMRFYPAPELVPEAFSQRPPQNATVDQKDKYIRNCVEANATYAFEESRKTPVSGLEVKRSLGLMKLFWRRYAMYRVDPQIDVSFTSPSISVSPVLLHIYGFEFPDV